MTATTLRTERSTLDALIVPAERELASGRPSDGERTLHEAITIAADHGVANRRLILLLLS